MTESKTGSIFFNERKGKFGTYYVAKVGDDEVTASLAKDGSLTIKHGDNTEMLKPKNNQYGDYYIGEIAGGRYFISKRTNPRGAYLLAKPAPERDMDTGGRPQRPAQYGSRN